ncbi:Transcriptional regulatory protein DegU [bacterium HR23]|nr:Transcriptional regulatory protein DegU [bacterium HR23]
MDTPTRKALQALANSADGLFAVDADYRITFWSESAEAILGYAPWEVIGKPCWEVVHGKDSEGAVWCQQDCPVARRLREGKAIPNYDIQTQRRDGRRVWLNVSIIPLPQGDGLPYTPVHLFRDITARKGKERLGEQVKALVAQAACTEETGESERVSPAPLTPREWEVLSLFAQGYSTAGVAKSLGVQKVTVQNHVQRILGKLGVHSRTEAIAWLYRRRHGGDGRALALPRTAIPS